MNSISQRFMLSLGLLLPVSAYPFECTESDWAEIERRLDQVIPASVDDGAYVRRLLSPRIAPRQLSEEFSVARAAAAFSDSSLKLDPWSCKPTDGHARHQDSGDEHRDDDATRQYDRADRDGGKHGGHGHHHPPGPGASLECGYVGSGGTRLRVKAEEGRYVYLNPGRSHRGFNENRVPQKKAARLTRKALVELGVPRREIHVDGVEIRDLMLSAYALDPRGELSGKQKKARAEVHVIFPRTVGGTPVWDSFGRSAVAADGSLARVHVNWPDFCVSETAQSQSVRGREDIIARVMRTIRAAGSCDTVGAVGAMVAYVKEKSLSGGLIPSGDEEEFDSNEGECFVPGIAVSVVGPDAADNGEISIAGQLLTYSLLAGGEMETGDDDPIRPVP